VGKLPHWFSPPEGQDVDHHRAVRCVSTCGGLLRCAPSRSAARTEARFPASMSSTTDRRPTSPGRVDHLANRVLRETTFSHLPQRPVIAGERPQETVRVGLMAESGAQKPAYHDNPAATSDPLSGYARTACATRPGRRLPFGFDALRRKIRPLSPDLSPAARTTRRRHRTLPSMLHRAGPRPPAPPEHRRQTPRCRALEPPLGLGPSCNSHRLSPGQ
jgi:hypothetical protein